MAVESAKLVQFANEIGKTLSQQRFATRQPNFLDSKRNEHTRHTQVVFDWQLGILRAVVAGSAIDAAVVAAIGDGDTQVGNAAAVLVEQARAFDARDVRYTHLVLGFRGA